MRNRFAGVLILVFAACGPTTGGDELPDEGETCDNYSYFPNVTVMNAAGVVAERDPDTGYHQVGLVPSADGQSTTMVFSPGIGISADSCLWYEAEVTIWEGASPRIVRSVPSTATSATTRFDALIPIRFDVPVSDLVSADASMMLLLNSIDGTLGEAFLSLDLREATTALPEDLTGTCEERFSSARTIQLLHDAGIEGEPLTQFDATTPAEMVWGFQGSPMITPKLRLDNPDGAASQCVNLVLTNTISGETVRGVRGSYRLSDDGAGGLISGFLYNELRANAANQMVAVHAVVFGPGFRAEQVIDVPVVDDE